MRGFLIGFFRISIIARIDHDNVCDLKVIERNFGVKNERALKAGNGSGMDGASVDLEELARLWILIQVAPDASEPFSLLVRSLPIKVLVVCLV